MTAEPRSESAGDRMEELIQVGTRLVDQIEAFTQESGRQFVSLAQRSRANRRGIWLVGVSLVLDLTLTVIMVFGWVQVSGNEHDISALTARLDNSQTVQRQKALCPLYQLLLGMKSPSGRAAAPDKTAYDHAFDVIQSGYSALDCSVFIGSRD